ncbi:MAG TPA: LytTR family DNA-binding domain-containing protein [Flavisolibacter sp.]|nr:LytTR family DNA-binding domain-containing protein [Flavisolibacter sp.]
MEQKLKVLIADDEQLSRELIRHYLKAFPMLELVGEAGSGAEALRLIDALQPHIVFLDIQMPDLTGLQLIRELSAEPKPLTVFVTAHDQFALAAFEESAIDYLLKPVSRQRFEKTVNRVIGFCKNQLPEKKPSHMDKLEQRFGSEAPASYLRNFTVREKGRVLLVPVNDVIYIESAGDYIRLVTSSRRYLIGDPLSFVESNLDPKVFTRIHRSYIIKLSEIVSLKPHTNGESIIQLRGGAALKLSRSYRHKMDLILDRLKNGRKS